MPPHCEHGCEIEKKAWPCCSMPRPLAARAHGRRGARLRARAVAGGAWRRQRHRHRYLRALHRLVERDVHLSRGLGRARARCGMPGQAAPPLPNLGRRGCRTRRRNRPGPPRRRRAGKRWDRSRRRCPRRSHLALALLRVGRDHWASCTSLKRSSAGVAGVAVGVVLAGQLAVGLLDLLVGGLLLDAERLVWILTAGMATRPPLRARAGSRCPRSQ